MADKEDPLVPGEHFGDYKVVRLLGRGGMGAVYLIEDESSGQQFAAKLMYRHTAKAHPEFVNRFVREARFAMRIRHRNLISVWDVGQDPDTGCYYLIMDYVSGGTLHDRIRREGAFIHPDDAKYIIRQIALALAAAHALHVVHRDIKPENIMFSAEGLPLLADLGIAKIPDTDDKTATLTMADEVIGTPAYMSPEQMRDSHSVDIRTDIYSLGIMFWEMLVGKRPSHGKTPMEIMAQAMSGATIPDVRTARPDVPAPIAELIALMCASKADDRVSSPAELLHLLDCIDKGQPLVRNPGEVSSDAVRHAPRRRPSVRRTFWSQYGNALIGAGAVGGALAILAGVLTWQTVSPSSANESGAATDSSALAEVAGDATTPSSGTGNVQELAITEDDEAEVPAEVPPAQASAETVAAPAPSAVTNQTSTAATALAQETKRRKAAEVQARAVQAENRRLAAELKRQQEAKARAAKQLQSARAHTAERQAALAAEQARKAEEARLAAEQASIAAEEVRALALEEGLKNRFLVDGRVQIPSKPGKDRKATVGRASLAMVACPEGAINLGNPAETNRLTGAFPRVAHIHAPFWIGRFKVTVEQWQALMDDLPNPSDADRLFRDAPVTDVSRYAIDTFCERLTEKARFDIGADFRHYVFRLPTDAEWEFALRAGSTNPSDPYACDTLNEDFRRGLFPTLGEFDRAYHLKTNRALLGSDTGLDLQDAAQVLEAGFRPLPEGKLERRGNAWKIVGMLGNGREAMISPDEHFGEMTLRGPALHTRTTAASTGIDGGFRVVFGPALK